MGYWARRFYERLSDRQIDRIFTLVTANDMDDALLKADEVSFDWHSIGLVRLLGHGAISKATQMAKIPFNLGGRW